MLERHIAYLKQTTALMHRKIANFIVRGKLTLINLKKGIYEIQGRFLAGETISDLQHPQEYGFASKPRAGACVLALFNGGNRDHGQAIIVYDPSKNPSDLGSGDSCQYDANDNRVWLKSDGGILIKNGDNTIELNNTGITITTNGLPVTFNAPVIFNQGYDLAGGNVTATGNGNISTGGQVSDANGSMQEMRDTYNSHTHNAPGGTTNAPNQPMS